MHGTSRDVSERYAMIKALKENIALYKAIFGNTGTATCITTLEGEIILANKEFERLCGSSIKKFVRRTIHKVFDTRNCRRIW